MRYAAVIENGERNCSAYVPDLPGCVSVGDTLNEVKAQIREAIHSRTMRCGCCRDSRRDCAGEDRSGSLAREQA
jgi:hypothetical protein